MMDTSGFAFPKPLTRAELKATATRHAHRLERAWKHAIWSRDNGHCRACGRRVVKSFAYAPHRGECHHLVQRAIQATRWDPDYAVLLCAACHQAVTEHRSRLVSRPGVPALRAADVCLVEQTTCHTLVG